MQPKKLIAAMIKNKETLLLTSKDIVDIAKKIGLDVLMQNTITQVEYGFKAFRKGTIQVPKREGLYFSNGLVEVMPVEDKEMICYKIGSVYKNNPRLGLPSTLANLILIDKNTGYPLAFVEDTFITALRTGAASGVATKYLANPISENIGLIGNGCQAYTQLHAIATVMPNLKKVFLYDKDISKSKRFVKEYQNLKIKGSSLEFIICSNPKEVCQNSDIITTSTTKSSNEKPVVRHSWIKEGTHINAVGTDIPKEGFTEIELNLLQKSKVVVDFYKQAIREGESQNLNKKEIYGELSEVILKEKKGRTNIKEITIFDSTGVAFQDLVTVKLFLDGYKRTIRFCQPSDITNPYSWRFQIL